MFAFTQVYSLLLIYMMAWCDMHIYSVDTICIPCGCGEGANVQKSQPHHRCYPQQ
jgi:hypothetical protein